MPFFLTYGLVQQFNVHIITDGFHMPMLLAAENIAGATYFKVAHGYFKAGAELSVFPDRFKAFIGYIGKRLARA